MVAAAYVGRVGGLAVALGVGSAIFAGQGVAWAGDTESTTSKQSTSKQSTSASADNETADRSATDTSATQDETEKTPAEPNADADADADPEVEPEPVPADTVEAEPEPANQDDDQDEDRDQDQDQDQDEQADPVTAPPKARETSSTHTATQTDAKRGSDTTQASDATQTTTSETTVADDSRTQRSDDPAVVPTSLQQVAVLATATSRAESNGRTLSPTVARVLSTQQDEDAVEKPTLVTAVVNVVNSMIDWARQKADAQPGDAPQPPFLWALMAFARRELDTLFAARSTTNAPRTTAVTPTSLAMDSVTTAALVPSYSPWLNPQVSPSTNFVSWVTGKNVYGDKTLANTLGRYGVHGTDVGVMWDNGMVDDPTTPWNEHQVLIAVGDTFGSPNMTGRWIYNTLFRSSDNDLSDGMTIPNGEWYNGNMFGGAPLSNRYEARPIINRPTWAPNSVTLIPTAGVSLPTEVTSATPFGTVQYVSFMSVSRWGQSGRWTTNYSAVAYSTDNGENFKVAPESVRYNSIFSGNRNFQQSAYVKGDDGYVYVYGTPNGRQGAAYLARVAGDDILDVSKYEYYKKASSGWFGSTPARWVKGSPSSASAIIGKSGGFWGFTKPGYTVSEMSVQYNEYLKKYVVLYGDQSNNIVMRTSDTPEGTWSDAKVLMTQQSGGIYAPMLHPWSPATQGTGSDLYWNLSLWSEYNIMLMRTDLSKI